MKEGTMDLRTIVPYTTRPIRAGEENGVEYFFTDEAGFQALKEQGKVIEDRAYDTVYGIWRYFTVDDGQIDLAEQNYLMIGTLEAYEKMITYYGREAILPVYIELDDGVRLQRALDRELRQPDTLPSRIIPTSIAIKIYYPLKLFLPFYSPATLMKILSPSPT